VLSRTWPRRAGPLGLSLKILDLEATMWRIAISTIIALLIIIVAYAHYFAR
jgi:hypothetical protein